MSGRGRVLGLVQAGGEGSRMDVLTRERAKPALPFAGVYQLIDFALSSLAHSGIADVWVSVQYLAGSLDPYLAGGRPWDLDRTRGGFRRVVPQQGDDPAESGFAQGNADDLLRLSREIEQLDPDQVVVMSADHVFACDLQRVLERHCEREAEATIVVAEVSRAEAAHNTTVAADATGLVRSTTSKPSRPQTGLVATEIFVYDTAVLIDVLGRLRVERSQAGDFDDTGIGDFAEHLLPHLVSRGRVWTAPIGAYWRDVGRPETYLQAHRDLIAGRVDVFDDATHPVLTRWPERPPVRVRSGAVVEDSLLAPGCDVAGTVVRSVLGPGVRVSHGAHVEDCVLFADTVVDRGARLGTSIVDTGVTVGRDAVVGDVSSRRRVRGDEVTLVGRDSRIRRRAHVAGGGRLEPGTVA